jgi:hypothetical protein
MTATTITTLEALRDRLEEIVKALTPTPMDIEAYEALVKAVGELNGCLKVEGPNEWDRICQIAAGGFASNAEGATPEYLLTRQQEIVAFLADLRALKRPDLAIAQIYINEAIAEIAVYLHSQGVETAPKFPAT